MTEGDGRASGAREVVAGDRDLLFEGPVTDMFALRESTKDNGDGSATLTFVVDAADLPKDLLSSPDNSVWHLRLDTFGKVYDLSGVRQKIRDKDKGKVAVAFAVFPSQYPPEAIYGRRNDPVQLFINMVAKENNHPFLTQASQRNKVMQWSVIILSDPEFGPWVAEQCRLAGYPVLSEVPSRDTREAWEGLDLAETYAEARAIEHLYRVAGVHSRADVLDDNAAAGRVENVLRRYRAQVWDRVERARFPGGGTT
jgi:hypothetical protein